MPAAVAQSRPRTLETPHVRRSAIRPQGHRLRAVHALAVPALDRQRVHRAPDRRGLGGAPGRVHHRGRDHAVLPRGLPVPAPDRSPEAPLPRPALGVGGPPRNRAVPAGVPPRPGLSRCPREPAGGPGAPGRGHLREPGVDDVPDHDLPRDRRRRVRRHGGVLRRAGRAEREHHHGGRLDLVGAGDDHDCRLRRPVSGRRRRPHGRDHPVVRGDRPVLGADGLHRERVPGPGPAAPPGAPRRRDAGRRARGAPGDAARPRAPGRRDPGQASRPRAGPARPDAAPSDVRR